MLERLFGHDYCHSLMAERKRTVVVLVICCILRQYTRGKKTAVKEFFSITFNIQQLNFWVFNIFKSIPFNNVKNPIANCLVFSYITSFVLFALWGTSEVGSFRKYEALYLFSKYSGWYK